MYKKSSLTFGERLGDLISEYNEKHEKKLTQKGIAYMLGVAPSRLSTLLNDKSANPTTSQIVTLCRFFHVTSDYLLGLSDVKSFDTVTSKISSATGLSENAIGLLKTFHRFPEDGRESGKPGFGDLTISTINHLTESMIDFERNAILAAEAKAEPQKRRTRPEEITSADKYELFRMKAIRIVDEAADKAIDEYCRYLKAADSNGKD